MLPLSKITGIFAFTIHFLSLEKFYIQRIIQSSIRYVMPNCHLECGGQKRVQERSARC